MSTEKTYGFGNSSPYRSDTFNKGNAKVFGKNGPLEIGKIYNDGQDIVLEDIGFVQQGIMVKKTGSVRVTFPAFLAPPFYLTATVPDTRPTDNIAWSFVRRPQDITPDLVLIAEWDGSEWRHLPLQTIKSILDYRLETAKAYNNLGFNQGFRFVPAPDFSSYLITKGQITDNTGNLVSKEEATNFSEIPEDVDFERIDAILWRRLTDDSSRIGQLIHRPAGTYLDSSPALVKQLMVSPDTNVSVQPRIINLADNSYVLLFIEGYGSNGVLKATKYSVDRTTQLVAPVTLATGVLEYSATLSTDGEIFIAYAKENNLYRMKIADDCTISIGSANIESLTNPILKPRVKVDAIGNHHCVFIYQTGPTSYAPYYMRFNVGGTVSVQPKRIVNNTSSYSEVDLDVNDDLILSVAYNNSTLGQVEFQTLDDIGNQITSLVTISNGTKFENITLSSPCRNIQVKCSENNELYITWEQEKGTNQYGFVIYNPKFQADFGAKAILHTFVTNTENIQYSKMEVDWGNHGHILVGNGSSILYYKFFLPSLGTRLTGNFEVLASGSIDFDIVFDKYGSLILAWADAQTGTSLNGAPVGSVIFGQGNFGTEGVFLGATEFATLLSSISGLTPVPTVGDAFTVSSSAVGNNGTFLVTQERVATINGSTYKVFRTNGTFSNENGGGVLVQFTNKNGNELAVAKQSSEVSYSFTEILAEQLSSDTIGFLVHRPSNQFYTWYSNTSVNVDDSSVKGESFLISEGLVSWDSTVAGGTLTWTQPIILRDPFRGDLEIAAGNITGFADADILYVKSPKSIPLSKDGDTDGVGVASVDDTSSFTIGGKVLVGDSDSTAVQSTVTGISNGKVTVGTSLAAYDVVRGAYIIPLTLTLQKGVQNVGDLKPNSLNEIDGRISTIATRKGTTVFFKDGALTLESGEDGQLGDGSSEETLAFIGAASETDSAPVYGASGYVTDGTSLRVAISTLALLLKTKGVSRIVWVSKDTGHNTTGDGSFLKPYLTYEKAHDSITDADVTKRYAIVMAPGDYIEADTFKHTKPYVNCFSFMKNTVTLKRTTLPFAFEYSTANRTEVHGVVFSGGLLFTKTVASPGSSYFELNNSKVEVADAVFNGTGISDIVNLNESHISTNLRLHSVLLSLDTSNVEGITDADDDFGTCSLYAQASRLNNVLSQSATNPVNVELVSSKVSGIITIDHVGSVVPPTLSIDASSYPVTEAQVVLTNDAVLERLTKSFAISYNPAVTTDYSNIFATQPVTVRDSLDTLAALSRYVSQLKLIPHETLANCARVTAADITLLDGRTLTQELRNLVMDFGGAVIDFETGEIFKQDGVTALGVDFIPTTIPLNEYAWYGIGLIPSTLGVDNTIGVQLIITTPSLSNASASLAPKPVIAGTKKLGGILVQNVSGSIIVSDIRQLGTGSGGGTGTGDENEFEVNLKIRLEDSYFMHVTPSVFSVVEDALVDDANTTAEYSLVDGAYKFSAVNSTFASLQLFNEEFLTNDDDSRQIEVHAEWLDEDSFDDDAVFQASLDGLTFTTVEMERHALSFKYTGSLRLPEPAHTEILGSTTNVVTELTAVSSITIPLVVASKMAAKAISLDLNKVGAPDGSFIISLKQGTTTLFSVMRSCSSLSSVSTAVLFEDFKSILPPGNYSIVIETDSTYKSTFSAGVKSIRYNGNYQLRGYLYDLRISVNSVIDSKLKAFGVFYDEQVGSVLDGVLAQERVIFSGDLNKSEFVITNFLPDSRMMKAYDIYTGQVYRFPVLSIDGHTVTFPAGTFSVPGQMLEVLFDQSEGSGYDYSDYNSSLLTANHLGSEDPTVDRSIAGRGILQRNLQGQLKEIWIDGETLYVTDPK